MSHAEFVNEALTGRQRCRSVGSGHGVCGDFSEVLLVGDQSVGETPGELMTCHQQALRGTFMSLGFSEQASTGSLKGRGSLSDVGFSIR
ncbi:MAG: hypothetical protein IPJ27_10905 [Candidatus Accumulibacter sp.]|uniref:Uncharacterized protein n=1 Tax=Candidatus Accumulibacter proximus TaxID=2954385 RepID=A0A935Q1E3_9PROT|nr:hypothetical protein [Candidatus Accumulibacter proximus]